MNTDDRIRERAYEIWEAAGRPEGREVEHWKQASEDVTHFDKPGDPLAGSVESSVAIPMPKRTKR